MPQMTIQQAFDLAMRHHQSGRLHEAEPLYRQILTQHPDHFNALHLLGVIAHQVGRHDAAVDLIRRAITLKPDFPEAYFNLGTVLEDMGHTDQAIAAYLQAIAAKPDYAEAHCNLGIALQAKGHLDQAIAAYRQAIRLKPRFPEAHNNLGNALKEKGQWDQAIAACRQAIALRPNYADAYYNLGNALNANGCGDEAINAYRQAVNLKPNYAAAYSNLGNALKDKGHLEEAATAYRQAIAIKHDYAEAHWNLALVLLPQGNFLQGWEEYEWRWQLNELAALRRNFTQPRWDGGDLHGRTLLLHAEQGLGDTLQFIRYLPLVAPRVGQVIVECPPELQRLLQTNHPDIRMVPRGQTLPTFDVTCPLLSVPRLLATTLANLPRQVPYLHAPAAEIPLWRQRLGPDTAAAKVGLVWRGGPKPPQRSCRLQQLAPLAQVPGVVFFSLQIGTTAAELAPTPDGLKLTDLSRGLHDFADTAAAIANLDLVITVDTALAHLAGAMGQPVWTLLKFVPDWRWLRERTDSPWYPTMRLFRQPASGDWDSVIQQVSKALTELVQTGGRVSSQQ